MNENDGKKWFEMKEQAAGKKRLLLLWYIYKFLGKKTVKFIVFFVTLRLENPKHHLLNSIFSNTLL